MATNFPATSLDTFPSAATLAAETLATNPHSSLHGDLGDSVAALEAKVGINASAVTTSVDNIITNSLNGNGYGTHAIGDVLLASSTTAWTKLAAGGAGKSITGNPNATNKAAYLNPQRIADAQGLVSGALAETGPYSRHEVGWANTVRLVSAQLFLMCIYLPAGLVVTNIVWRSATTGAGTPLNQWFCLTDSAFTVLVKTADDGATAWAANANKSLACSAAYTVVTTGLYFLGIMVKATTPPTLWCNAVSGIGVALGPSTLAPVWGGQSTAALTNPASLGATAATPTIDATGQPWGYVS